MSRVLGGIDRSHTDPLEWADHEQAWAKAERDHGIAWSRMDLSERTFAVASALAELRNAAARDRQPA